MSTSDRGQVGGEAQALASIPLVALLLSPSSGKRGIVARGRSFSFHIRPDRGSATVEPDYKRSLVMDRSARGSSSRRQT